MWSASSREVLLPAAPDDVVVDSSIVGKVSSMIGESGVGGDHDVGTK